MKWVQAFPACVFGFTGTLLDPRKCHPELLKVVASMDLGCILLKIDSPLIIPPKYRSEAIQHSNPLMIIDIAKEVARLWHLQTTTIINMAHHPFLLPNSSVISPYFPYLYPMLEAGVNGDG